VATDRAVLVHYHIFKNAGTSVRSVLKESFGSASGSIEGAHAHDTQTVEDLRRFLQDNPHVKAVSSHLVRPPLPWPGCRAIAFLRHPIDRAHSVFQFVRRVPGQPNAEIARARGFAGYMRWALDGGRGGVVLRNYQVVHLSQATWRNGGVLDAVPTEPDLHEACALIEEWGVHGIVDRFEASSRLFQRAYRQAFPVLRFANVWHNRRQAGTCPWRTSRPRFGARLGKNYMKELERSNALDLRLYQFAEERFAQVYAAHGVGDELRR
jgi:Sulfotransferase family